MKTRETLDGESDDGVEVQYSALGRGSPNVNTDDVQTCLLYTSDAADDCWSV